MVGKHFAYNIGMFTILQKKIVFERTFRETEMTNNGPLPQLTKKHNISSSLWSSLPVTALLRGQQYESKESFLSAAQQDQDEEREQGKDFLLAAQGPNLLLLPWEGGEPHERLQVQEKSAKLKKCKHGQYILSMFAIMVLCCYLSCNIFAYNRSIPFQVFHSNAIHGLQWVGSGLVLVRGGKSRATVKVKMKKKEKEEKEYTKMMVVVEKEVLEEDWLLASYSIDSSLFLLTAHNKLLVRGEERREVKASSGPCILYR